MRCNGDVYGLHQIGDVVVHVLGTENKRAVLCIGKRAVIRATRIRYRFNGGKIRNPIEIRLTIGKANARESEQLKRGKIFLGTVFVEPVKKK